jgi:hypothetical protein
MKMITNVVAKVYDDKGILVTEQVGHNALTDGVVGGTYYNARTMILQRMTGDNDSASIPYNDSVITNMELGTGTPDDTGLGTAYSSFSTIESIDSWTWDYTTSPTSIDVTASTSWDSSYAAISGVTEAGLYNNNDEPLAIKTFSPALAKTTGGTITIEWKITLA